MILRVPETRRTVVGFDAKRLYELTQALHARDSVVALELDLEELDTVASYKPPIQIRTKHGTGVLMPVTIER